MDQSSLGGDPLRAFKSRATELQAEAKARGESLKRSAALEAVAHERGFRDWNAASATAKTALQPLKRESPQIFLWRDIERPLPVPLLRFYPSSSKMHDSIRELMRWASQVDLIAESFPVENRQKLMGGVGGQVPYVFAQDRGRWSDDLYRLCDRGYDPWKGIAFTRDELAAAGVPEWEEEHGNHGGSDMYSVAWDEVMHTRNATTLKRLARLVAGIAMVAQEAYERQKGQAIPHGRGFTIDLKDPEQLSADNVARLIGSRDDSVHRELRVSKDGIAYLSDIVGNADTGGLAFSLGVWVSGNGYVGLEASRDEQYVEEVLEDLRNNWPTPTTEVNDWT
jgi:hypothetical protein